MVCGSWVEALFPGHPRLHPHPPSHPHPPGNGEFAGDEARAVFLWYLFELTGERTLYNDLSQGDSSKPNKADVQNRNFLGGSMSLSLVSYDHPMPPCWTSLPHRHHHHQSHPRRLPNRSFPNPRNGFVATGFKTVSKRLLSDRSLGFRSLMVIF